MELIRLTKENLASEHICCAIAGERDMQVLSKKAWLSERLDEGLVFLKGDVRGKCFIEYLPAEAAWAPVEAPDCAYVDCLWVSGQFKGHGYADLLLDACIQDCREKGKKGIAVLSSPRKMGFLSDAGYLRHRGFETVDSAKPYFELLFLPLGGDVAAPRFKPQVKRDVHADMPEGLVLYYTAQCPFTARYVPLIVEQAAKLNAPLTAVPFLSAAEAQNAPSPFTTYALFHNGRFLTHEILSEKKFEKLLPTL